MSKCWICGKEMTKTIGSCEHCKDCGTGYNDLVFRPQNETIIYHNKIVDNGTAIHLTCDCCGREVFTCNIVNGMKFCAKCYQETFGETDKDKQIAELQKQLKSQPAEIVEKIKQNNILLEYSPQKKKQSKNSLKLEGKMSKLDNIKIFNSPITNEVYLCSVNSKNLITEKRKLNEQDMMEFIFGIIKTLENKYGRNIKFEDDLLIINVEVLHKQLTHHHEDKGE